MELLELGDLRLFPPTIVDELSDEACPALFLSMKIGSSRYFEELTSFSNLMDDPLVGCLPPTVPTSCLLVMLYL